MSRENVQKAIGKGGVEFKRRQNEYKTSQGIPLGTGTGGTFKGEQDSRIENDSNATPPGGLTAVHDPSQRAGLGYPNEENPTVLGVTDLSFPSPYSPVVRKASLILPDSFPRPMRPDQPYVVVNDDGMVERRYQSADEDDAMFRTEGRGWWNLMKGIRTNRLDPEVDTEEYNIIEDIRRDKIKKNEKIIELAKNRGVYDRWEKMAPNDKRRYENNTRVETQQQAPKAALSTNMKERKLLSGIMQRDIDGGFGSGLTPKEKIASKTYLGWVAKIHNLDDDGNLARMPSHRLINMMYSVASLSSNAMHGATNRTKFVQNWLSNIGLVPRTSLEIMEELKPYIDEERKDLKEIIKNRSETDQSLLDAYTATGIKLTAGKAEVEEKERLYIEKMDESITKVYGLMDGIANNIVRYSEATGNFDDDGAPGGKGGASPGLVYKSQFPEYLLGFKALNKTIRNHADNANGGVILPHHQTMLDTAGENILRHMMFQLTSNNVYLTQTDDPILNLRLNKDGSTFFVKGSDNDLERNWVYNAKEIPMSEMIDTMGAKVAKEIATALERSGRTEPEDVKVAWPKSKAELAEYNAKAGQRRRAAAKAKAEGRKYNPHIDGEHIRYERGPFGKEFPGSLR